MKLSRVQIEKFCGIKKIDLSINHDLQILAGPNNACKSTILRAINFFFSGIDDTPKESYAPQNQYYINEGGRSLTKITLSFSELSEEDNLIFNEAYLPRKKEFWIQIRTDRIGKISFSSSGGNAKDLYEKLIERYDFIYVPAVRASASGSNETETRKIFLAVKSALSKRKRGSLNSLQKDFITASEYVTTILSSILEESKKSIISSLPEGTDITFQFPTSDFILDLILSQTTIGTRRDTELTIDDEGTGFQSLLSLGLLKYVEQNKKARHLLLLIEEPEAFLHPQFQRAVANYILDLSKKSQVILTTHSSVMLDQVKIENIIRLKQDSSGLDFSWRWPQEEARHLDQLSRYCNTKNSELIFADKVILCEGITDHTVISHLIENILNKNHHHLNVSVIDGEGGSIKYISKLLNWFEIDYILAVDKDVYTGTNKKLLQEICNDKKDPLTQDELDVLNKAKQAKCENPNDAYLIRNEVNDLLESRNIFTLSSDMEGALVHSIRKKSILDILGKNGIDYLNEDTITELTELKNNDFYFRLDQLVGSKGWNTQKASENKLKPHVVIKLIERISGYNFIDQSDLDELTKTLNNFIHDQ